MLDNNLNMKKFLIIAFVLTNLTFSNLIYTSTAIAESKKKEGNIYTMNKEDKYSRENSIFNNTLSSDAIHIIDGQLTTQEKNNFRLLGVDSDKLDEISLEGALNEANKHFDASIKWKKIRCSPEISFVCTKNNCIKRVSDHHLNIDKEKSTIFRCKNDNEKDCTNYPFTYIQSGVFSVLQSNGPFNATIKILGDSEYKETTLFGLDAYIYNGKCMKIE